MESSPAAMASSTRSISSCYTSALLRRAACGLHRRIGEWGQGALSARVKDPAAELAMHFERGQDHPRAIEYLTQAADSAMRRQAPHEAVVLLGKSLTLLANLPDSAGRAQHELTLLVAIGVPLLMTKGYAAEDVERTYARAQELCQQVGESPQLLPALAGLFRFYFVRADFQAARALAEQILRLAENTRDPVVFLIAHSLLGVLLLSLGEFVAARGHLEKGIALYSAREHRFMASLYGDDPGVTCLCFAAMSLWFLGYPDQALANVQRALMVAKETESPYCETFALDFVTWIHVLRREEHAAQASIHTLTRIATEQGFQFLLADCGVLHGWILAAQGTEADGVQLLHPAMAAYEATGAVMSRPAHLMLLAKVYGKAGQTEEALAALAGARAAVDQAGERTYDAELYRLTGELLLQAEQHAPHQRSAKKTRRIAGTPTASPGDGSAVDLDDSVEACFRTAMEIARRQQAKSLELRAATSLSRLWQRQGKRHQAHAMLSEIRGWFSEGFDTPDLREADTLLAELA